MHAANDSLSMLVVQDRTKKVSEQASKQGSYFGQKEDKLEDLPPLPKSDKTSGTGQKCTEACGKGPNAVFLGCKSALLLNSRLIIPNLCFRLVGSLCICHHSMYRMPWLIIHFCAQNL